MRSRLRVSSAGDNGPAIECRESSLFASHPDTLPKQAGPPLERGMPPYRVLGLTARATNAEIKAAYKKLALKWHPDAHHGAAKAQAEEKFKTILSAYQALTPENTKTSSPDTDPDDDGRTTSAQQQQQQQQQRFPCEGRTEKP